MKLVRYKVIMLDWLHKLAFGTEIRQLVAFYHSSLNTLACDAGIFPTD